jgi:chromosome transmission fidelity protein 8
MVTIFPPVKSSIVDNSCPNPLPKLIQTPSGLAIVEIQGTIHTPPVSFEDGDAKDIPDTKVGNLVFPLYNEESADDTSWMKLIYLYIGKHQRLTGQVKKLPKAMAILQKKNTGVESLEITDIIKYKIVFSQRPEPVGEE